MSGNSPKWKRPSDVMKIHRKRKRLSQNRSFSEEIKVSGVLQDSTNVILNSTGSKRKNPFSSESFTDGPYKRKRSDTDDKLPNFNENTQAFFAILENVNKVSKCTQAQASELLPIILLHVLEGRDKRDTCIYLILCITGYILNLDRYDSE